MGCPSTTGTGRAGAVLFEEIPQGMGQGLSRFAAARVEGGRGRISHRGHHEHPEQPRVSRQPPFGDTIIAEIKLPRLPEKEAPGILPTVECWGRTATGVCLRF